jgi:hypothetical protein
MAPVALGANITPGADAVLEVGSAGEAITIGNAVYRDATDSNKLKKAVNTSLAAAQIYGIAMGTAPDDGAVLVQKGGTINGTATLLAGGRYFASSTAGSVEPSADVGSGDFATHVGQAPTTTSLKLAIDHAVVAHA